MESPKDQLIEMYYRRIQAMSDKIEQLQKQIAKGEYNLDGLEDYGKKKRS